MIWVFDYTIPSFIVLVLFLIIYFLDITPATKSNKCFFVVVIAEVLGFLATLISSIIDNNHSLYTQGFLTFINHSYYIMYTFRFFLYTRYFAYLLHKENRFLDIISYASFIVVLIFILINPITSYIYSISPSSMFQTGDMILLIYVCNITTVIVDFYYVLTSLKGKSAKEKITLLFCVIILLSSCITDLFLMDYIISDMFFIVVIGIIFLIFENSDIYRDNKTSIYTLQAFKQSIQDYIVSKKEYSVFSIMIKNYPQLRQIYGNYQMNVVLKEIASYFLSCFTNKKLNFYYLDNGRFILIDKGQDKNIKDTIKERFTNPWALKNGTTIMLKIIVVQMDKEIILQTYEEVEKTFDEAFNEAVQTSKETILLDSSFYSLIQRKNEILKALNTAITNDSLEVYLQPLIDSNTKKIIAAEALVRIKDKELGLIPPSEFISMAEENGYIETLGEQVLNKVCNFLENIEGTKYHLQWINVNLSPIQCLDSNLLKIVNEIVDRHHISHDLIHLEITEECIIDIDLLRSQMEKLITSGYKISLDDFGSGFSNLSMIKVLPFSNIKLDMSIVKGHFTHPDEMLPGIVDTFTKKGLSVTAEGVETKEMSEELTCIGCTYLQGFCFSRPIPMKDFVELLDKS